MATKGKNPSDTFKSDLINLKFNLASHKLQRIFDKFLFFVLPLKKIMDLNECQKMPINKNIKLLLQTHKNRAMVLSPFLFNILGIRGIKLSALI